MILGCNEIFFTRPLSNMLHVMLKFPNNEIIKNKSLLFKINYYFGVDLTIFFKVTDFSPPPTFLIASSTCTDIPYRFLSISKLVRTMSVVSVEVATPIPDSLYSM